LLAMDELRLDPARSAALGAAACAKVRARYDIATSTRKLEKIHAAVAGGSPEARNVGARSGAGQR
jgi:hypothetical protein